MAPTLPTKVALVSALHPAAVALDMGPEYPDVLSSVDLQRRRIGAEVDHALGSAGLTTDRTVATLVGPRLAALHPKLHRSTVT
jgi:hypothetical protein